MKKLLLTSGVLLMLLACSKENPVIDTKEIQVAEKKSIAENGVGNYNYKDSELLRISSILLAQNDEKSLRAISSKKNSVIAGVNALTSSNVVNAPLNVKDLEIKYLNLEQQGDSVVVAVENKVQKKTLILSKDKRHAPVLGFVNSELKVKSIPPEMKYYLSGIAKNIRLESKQFMEEKDSEVVLKDLDLKINNYFAEISIEKLKAKENNIILSGRKRDSQELESILSYEDVVYVKRPLLKTEWNQENYFIMNHPVYSKEHFDHPEGCVVTAVGQVLNYWENYVRKITFGSPFGGQYFNEFTRTSFDYPYRKSSLNKKDYMEIQFNISQQIIRSAGSEGRATAVVNQNLYSKDLRTFIEKHVEGVRVADYTGQFNMINSDEYYVIQSIEKDRPAIVAGTGHAWVCDGLVKIRVKRGFWPVRWTEHKYYIHMNWGWGPGYNGWFFNNGSDYYKPKDYETYFEIEEMISIAPN